MTETSSDVAEAAAWVEVGVAKVRTMNAQRSAPIRPFFSSFQLIPKAIFKLSPPPRFCKV